ncbi:MAG: DUF192 domain-containing protein, partial [bacterium]|nr:DUF192 domain-containing protein [bacterium]
SDGGVETTTSSSASAVTTQPPTSASTVAPEPEPPTNTTSTAAPVVPAILESFGVEQISIDGTALLVAVADTGDLRRQGLMNLQDLGDLDGMLFVFDRDSSGGFWMRNTLIPLDIAFFAVDGTFVDGFAMEPCRTDDCPTYSPSGAYRYAVELPRGEMPDEVWKLSLDR